mgnify:CR=1 FL=1
MLLFLLCTDRMAAASRQMCREGLEGTYIFIPVLRAPLLRRSPPCTCRGNRRQTSQAHGKALPRAREALGGGGRGAWQAAERTLFANQKSKQPTPTPNLGAGSHDGEAKRNQRDPGPAGRAAHTAQHPMDPRAQRGAPLPLLLTPSCSSTHKQL